MNEIDLPQNYIYFTKILNSINLKSRRVVLHKSGKKFTHFTMSTNITKDSSYFCLTNTSMNQFHHATQVHFYMVLVVLLNVLVGLYYTITPSVP